MVSFICLRGTVKGTRTTRRRSFSQNTASLKKLPRYMNWCVQLFRYFFFLFLCLVCCFLFFFLLFHVLFYAFCYFTLSLWFQMGFALLLGNGAHDVIGLSESQFVMV